MSESEERRARQRGQRAEYRFGLVLLLLLATFVVLMTGSTSTWIRPLTVVLTGATLLAALFAADASVRLRRIAAVVVAISIVGSLTLVRLDKSGQVVAGLLDAMLVVFAPVAGWLAFRDRLPATGWIAVGIATAGLALLSLRGNGFGPGELLTLLAAAVWALHLVLLSRWAEPEHAIGLAAVQSATVAGMALVAAAVGAAVAGRAPLPTLPVGGAGWLGVLFLAVLATAAAMVLLSWAQSRMSATRAAIILTLEPAVAGVTAACLGTELGPKTLVGGALLVTAMVVVELRTGRAAGCVT